MAKKSMSNRAQVEKIMSSAKKAIAKAEKSGQIVPDNIKKLASTPIKTRYSKREVEGIKYHLDPRHIAAEARKSTNPVKRHTMTFSNNKSGSHQISFKSRDNEVPTAIAKEIYKGISYALKYHPSRDFDTDVRRFLSDILKYNINMYKDKFAEGKKLTKKEFIINDWKKISKEDFIKKFVEKYDSDFTSYFYAAIEAIVSSGRLSPKDYKKFKKFTEERAMKSFADNYKLTPERAKTIYDFFQKSSVWNTYRNNFSPSDDISIDELLGDIEEALDGGMTISDIDEIINNNKTKNDTTLVRIALENAIQNATKDE